MTARTVKPASDTGTTVTTKIVLIVEYDGTRYYGFQWQSDLPTVQGEIETAISKLTGERLRIAAASRTDTGVHARAQVVSFRTASSHSPDTFVSGLNYYLPRDIAIKAAHKVEDSFDVRRRATSREYEYHILNTSVRSPLRASGTYRVGGELDIAVMNRAGQAIIGEHDLASFASDPGNGIINTTRRVYKAEFSRNEELVVFAIRANSFLPHQVRNTVGAMVRIGQGKMNVGEFYSIINAKKTGLAGPTAPACGLYLTRVNYPHSFGEKND